MHQYIYIHVVSSVTDAKGKSEPVLFVHNRKYNLNIITEISNALKY